MRNILSPVTVGTLLVGVLLCAGGAVPASGQERSLPAEGLTPDYDATESMGESADRLREAHAAFVGPPSPPLFDEARLTRMLEAAEELPGLTSLLISRRDSLIVERYWRGMTAGRAVNVKSVSKTLLSPMVGIAIRDGLFEGLDQPLSELLPDYYERLRAREDWDPRKERITLRHLLTMRTGLETTSFRNYGAWVSSSDWAWDQLRRPLRCDPGSCHAYSTGTTHLLSVILTRVSDRSLRRYMRDELLGPMGIPLGEWDRDPQGNYLGGNNMPLRPRDMLALGQLFADRGWYEDRELVPESWIAESWAPRGTSPWNGHGFGYLWWSDRWGGETAHFGWGYGGQFIVVVPGLQLVFVATSSLDQPSRGSSRRLRRFFDAWLVPAFQY
ncbi:MAG: beta-lactamase family protein [marine benthic group bacterium]|nr:beta-lactamase family protein [Gemmatimonadota bacterium]